jgi:hypothetical protein
MWLLEQQNKTRFYFLAAFEGGLCGGGGVGREWCGGGHASIYQVENYFFDSRHAKRGEGVEGSENFKTQFSRL